MHNGYLSMGERHALLLEALGNPSDLSNEEKKALTWLISVGDTDMTRAFVRMFRRAGALKEGR